MHPVDIKNELRLYPFFQNFPEETLLLFATMTEVKSWPKGSLILEQGQLNHSLYFLRSGSLEILVDGERVSQLHQKGEILGEMSLIGQTPVVATVQAAEDTTMFVVSEIYLKSLPQSDKLKFQNLMNGVLTRLLGERLTRTNEKAKRFEIANRSLQIAQESLENLNKNLENEIARRSKDLVEKVKELTESHLAPTLQDMIAETQRESSHASDSRINGWAHALSEVLDLLKPVIDLSQKSGNSRFHRVLLCDPHKKQQSLAKLALGGTGVDLTLTISPDEAMTALKETHYDLILIDAEAQELVSEAKKLNSQTEIVLLLNHEMTTYLELLKNFENIKYFVSRDLNNRIFTIKSIATTVSKILNKDIFGMEKYLSWGAHVQEQKISSSTDRATAIEKILGYFRTYGIRTTFLERVQTVTEELLMNSIYDAPVDEEGRHLYNHLPRTEVVRLSESQASTLRYTTDGVLLAVSVSDPFGSLTKSVLQSYLEKNHLGHETEDASKGGAGKGLHMILTNSDLVIFNVRENKRTEVISLFNLEANKEIESLPTFHLFFEK